MVNIAGVIEMTYDELQRSDKPLEDKAQYLHDNALDYMCVGEFVLINEGDGEVWLCEDSDVKLDTCRRIRQIAVFIGHNEEGLAIYKGVLL